MGRTVVGGSCRLKRGRNKVLSWHGEEPVQDVGSVTGVRESAGTGSVGRFEAWVSGKLCALDMVVEMK